MKNTLSPSIPPFQYSDTNKRYHTYDYYLRHRYGGKCVKISLDAGFTCPNIDGKRGYGGCLYCSPRGSGDFTMSGLSLREQYAKQRELMSRKWETVRCIPYLQAHTNTYAPISVLSRVYREVLALPDAVAFHIATRADCLGREVLLLLREVSEQIDLTVELGLQSVYDETAELIRRGHTFAEFCEGFYALREMCPRARISVHMINGLPGEDKDRMLSGMKTLAELKPDEVKIHLLHVLRDTPLATLYERGEYTPLTKESYVDILTEQLALLPAETVIGRVTGDGAPTSLLAPLWSLKKLTVINAVDLAMLQKGLWQGKNYKNYV